MKHPAARNARKELGAFLASRRARLSPRDFGLYDGRRRVPGLRREEVAALANVSETWYARLESGRDISVSDDILESIARVLRLQPDERDYLFMLARASDRTPPPEIRPALPPAVLVTLDELHFSPAVVYGPRWDVLAQNAAHNAVFGDIAAVPIARGNALRRIFLDSSRRALFPDWETVARTMLHMFRLTAGRYAADPSYASLTEDLRAESPEFAAWWEQHDVKQRIVGAKRLRHPVMGELLLHHVAFALPQWPGLHIIVYTAEPDSESERKLHEFLDGMRKAD
jgi:transcriptional regulator with XRE-family HTH domain